MGWSEKHYSAELPPCAARRGIRVQKTGPLRWALRLSRVINPYRPRQVYPVGFWSGHDVHLPAAVRRLMTSVYLLRPAISLVAKRLVR
jgi:hypothetical protein